MRNEAHRTLSLDDALRGAEPLLPTNLGLKALKMNLALLSTYRNNAVHFYNAEGFGSVIYALAQTAIVNLKDLSNGIFAVDLREEITWQLLPLALDPPIDPLQYMSGRQGPSTKNTALQQFLQELAKSTQALESQNLYTGRLLTVFRVKLESTKKIQNADLDVGAQTAGAVATSGNPGPPVVTKSVDPNITHPLSTADVIKAIGTLHGRTFTSNTFQAIAWNHSLKENAQYCWKLRVGSVVRYSHERVTFIRRLTEGDVDLATQEYRERNAHRVARAQT